MDKSVWTMLNETEKALLRAAEPKALDALDEDGLAELHDRVRRARRKYSKLYRRRAAEQVDSDATRSRAHAAHARTLVKAEAFEETLAVVSSRLARAAKASAAELRAERIAAARADRGPAADGASGRRSGPARAPATPARRPSTRTPVKERATASARATKRRTEAKRDARGSGR